MRHRDQQATEATTLTGGAIAIQYDKWFALEDGVQMQFPAPTAPNDNRRYDAQRGIAFERKIKPCAC